MAQTSNEGPPGTPRHDSNGGGAPATGTEGPPQQAPERRNPAPQNHQPPRRGDFAPGEDGECH